MHQILCKKVQRRGFSGGEATVRARYVSQLVHNMKDTKHNDSAIESRPPIFSLPSYDNNEQIRKDIQTMIRSQVPLNTLRSIGKQLQPRARVKWEFYVKHVEEKLKEMEDKLVPLLEIKPSEQYQQVRTRPRTLTPSIYLIPPPQPPPEQELDLFSDSPTTSEESINHAVNFLRSKKESTPVEKTNVSDNVWRNALNSFLDETYQDKYPTEEQMYLDKWNLSSEWIGYKWEVDTFDEQLAHWEEAPLVIFPFRKGYHYYKFESLAYPFPDYIKKMEEIERNETVGLWHKIAQFEFLEPIKIAEEIEKDKASLTESNLSTPLKEKLEYCKSELSKLPKYQKPKTKAQKEWSDVNLYCGSVREVADVIFAGAIARAKITGHDSLVTPLTKLYETLLFSDTEKFSTTLSVTLANNINLRNFLQHHIIKYFGESEGYPNIFQQLAPRILRNNEFSLQEESKLVSKVAESLLPGGISQIDQEIERIRKGEPDQFEAPSIVNISKDDMKEMIADVEEIEKRGPEQFKSNQKNAESATPARDPEELKQIIDVLAEEDTLDDIDSPELDDLELKLREELEPQKKDLSDFVMPSEDLKDENFNEAYVDVVNQMEVDDIEAEFPTEQEEELTTIEEMDNFEERQMEEFSENAAAQLKHGPPIESDRDYFVKPVPFPIPKLEFSQEMPDFEKHVMDTNTDDTPDIPNLDLSCLDPSYNFLERTEQQLLEEREIHPTMMSERWGVLNMKVGKLFLVQRTSCIRTNRLPSERKELEDGLTYTPLPYPEFGDSSPLPMDEQPPVQVKEDEEDIPNEEDEEQSKTLYPETLGAMNELRNHLSTIDALKRDNCVSERDKEGLRKVESILVAYAKRNNIPLSHDDEMESEESESFDTSMKSLEKELNGEDEVIINSQYLTNLDKEDEELQEDQVDEGENVVGEGEQVVGEGEEVGEGDIAVEEGVSAKDGKEEAVARGDSEYDSKNENMEEEDEEFTDLDPNYAPIMEMVADMPIEDTDEPAQELPTSIEEYTEMKMKEMKEAEARAETETPKKDEEESTSEVEPLDVDEVIRICETLDSTNPKTEEFKKNMQRLVAFNYLPSKTMRSKYYHPEIPPEAWEEVRKQTQLEVDEWLEFDKKCNKSFLETNGPTTLQAKMIDISPKQLLEMKKVTWPFATPVTFTNPLRLILSVDWAKQSCPWAVPED